MTGGEEMVFWDHAPELPGNMKRLKVVTDAHTWVLVTAHKDRTVAAPEPRTATTSQGGVRPLVDSPPYRRHGGAPALLGNLPPSQPRNGHGAY